RGLRARLPSSARRHPRAARAGEETPLSEPEIPLPPLYESVLDDATLDALFGDVGALGEVLVTVKGAPTEHAAEAPVTLADARDALVAGRVRGVQLRYVHEGQVWCDTLMRLS